MNRVIVMGSPRSEGRSAHLAEMIFEACINECPEDELALIPISERPVQPCNGCDVCRTNEGVCSIDDDMGQMREVLDEAEELIIVAPVYFSGCPAPFKAFLDRLQPYFWTRTANEIRRPAILHIVGEGGDRHGFDALISEVRSAIAVAGFKVELILSWVGCIEEDGTIVKEAVEVALPELGSQFEAVELTREAMEFEEIEFTDSSDSGAYIEEERPRLDLSASGGNKNKKKKNNSQNYSKNSNRSNQKKKQNRSNSKSGNQRNKNQGKKNQSKPPQSKNSHHKK